MILLRYVVKMILFVILTIIIVGSLYRLMLWWEGFIVTSWWRSPWDNEQVKGVSWSLHQIGWGFDIVPVNNDVWQRLNDLPFGQVLNEDAGDNSTGKHYHLQIIKW